MDTSNILALIFFSFFHLEIDISFNFQCRIVWLFFFHGMMHVGKLFSPNSYLS